MRSTRRPPDGVTVTHNGRGLCSTCLSRAQREGTLDNWPPVRISWVTARAELVAYIEQLRMTGLPPESWAKDLGTTNSALARRLYRAGRPDLAREVERLRQRAYRTQKRKAAA